MISCTEFIPAYSELFRYLEERGGREEVVRTREPDPDPSDEDASERSTSGPTA